MSNSQNASNNQLTFEFGKGKGLGGTPSRTGDSKLIIINFKGGGIFCMFRCDRKQIMLYNVILKTTKTNKYILKYIFCQI